MKRFVIERDPIEIEVGQITEIKGENKDGYRLVVLDTAGEVFAREDNEEPLKVGECLHQSIAHDVYIRLHARMLPPSSRLVEVGSSGRSKVILERNDTVPTE